MTAGGHIEQIIEALQLAQLPRLRKLRINYDAGSEFTSEDGLLESPPSDHPPILRGIKSLQTVRLYLGFSRMARRENSTISQILRHGENLIDVYCCFRCTTIRLGCSQYSLDLKPA